MGYSLPILWYLRTFLASQGLDMSWPHLWGPSALAVIASQELHKKQHCPYRPHSLKETLNTGVFFIAGYSLLLLFWLTVTMPDF